MTQQGWKNLSELKVGESILVLSGVENDGIRPNTTTLTGRVSCYTEKSTKPTTEKSQKVIKSITSTTTRLITGLKTWWHSLLENTTNNMSQKGSLSPTLTKQKVQGLCGQTESPNNTTAQSVDRLLNLHAQGQGSVAPTVMPSTVITKLEAEETDVYNIEVEEHHEYFANGILNHNCAWTKDSETWDMLQFTLRLGRHPRVFIATTPKPTKLIRQIMADPKTLVVRGSTFDNEANLAPTFLEAVKRQYEGTRLGKQELYAEVLEEAEGALWNTDTLDACQVDRKDVPDLNRIVVSIDPAVTANKESDMTGMVVAGVDVNGIVYVLGDYTEKLSPQGWASKAIGLYHQFEADRVVAEKNQGGDMVKRTLEVEDETVPIKLVHASRGKMARAEPVSALYERGLVKHVRNPQDGANLEELETQMRTWEPLGSIGSPDRLDALVWACTELALGSYQRPTMQLVYESAKGLR
jgi:phage terminase large subunit-like protein